MDERKVLRYCHQCDAWNPDLSICNSHYHKVEFKFVPLITYCRYCGLLDLWENLRNCRHERLLTPDACPTVNFKIKKKAIKRFHDDVLDNYSGDMLKFRGCDMPEIFAHIDRINRYPIINNGITTQAMNSLIDLSNVKRIDDMDVDDL